MTISATGRRYDYAGNGVTVDFSFPRPFAANPDLKVYLVLISTGVATLQTYSTHYSIAGAGLDAGGTVTFLTPPDALNRVVIFADTDATQNLDLDNVSSWPMTSIEYAFDRLTIMVQEVWDRLLRVPYAPREYINTFDYKLPLPTATYLLAINAAGTGFEFRSATGSLWIVAAGAPGGATGATGDMYINSSNGDVYGPKTTVWGAAVFNITGPAGAPGAPGSGSGDVVGPASSVANRIAIFADTTGKLLADGGALISDLLAKAGGTMTGLLTTVASAAVAGAGFRLPPGVAPNSPTNGDVWTTSAALFYRVNGVTLTSMDLETAQTLTAKKTFPVGATGAASLTIPSGVAPSSPVEGDVWKTSTLLQVRLNSITETLATRSANTFTGKQITVASASGGAGLNLPHGAAPSAPVDGDFWTETTGAKIRINGATVSLGSGGGITITAEQATTSGPATRDFTGIPAGVKRIVIMLDQVSSDSTGVFLIQIGDAGGFETTGYVSGAVTTSNTSGFLIASTVSAAANYSGAITLNLEDATNNTWVATGNLVNNSGVVQTSAGVKSLSAVLTQVRFTNAAGDNYDLGGISISYE